jgi:hypothetical protein
MQHGPAFTSKRLGTSLRERALAAHLVRLPLLVLSILVSACTTTSVPAEHLKSVAVISAGDTNLRLMGQFKSRVSVLLVDGVVPEHPHGPIELALGAHEIRLRCGATVAYQKIIAEPGEVYEFGATVDVDSGKCQPELRLTSPAN